MTGHSVPTNAVNRLPPPQTNGWRHVGPHQVHSFDEATSSVPLTQLAPADDAQRFLVPSKGIPLAQCPFVRTGRA
jgi:hypothetical protein